MPNAGRRRLAAAFATFDRLDCISTTLTIRDVPDDVYQALKALAARNRRSLSQQAVTLLEHVRALPATPPSERASSTLRR